MADHEGNIVLTESSVDLVNLAQIQSLSKVMARQQRRKGGHRRPSEADFELRC
jgi:hypothetical protein